MAKETWIPLRSNHRSQSGIAGLADQGRNGHMVSGSAQQISEGGSAGMGLRGRRKNNGDVEKVIERRQRRMIKNRESAWRSRARKQKYMMELEAEVKRLKDENQEVRRKQEYMMELEAEVKRLKDENQELRRKQDEILGIQKGNQGNQSGVLEQTPSFIIDNTTLPTHVHIKQEPLDLPLDPNFFSLEDWKIPDLHLPMV